MNDYSGSMSNHLDQHDMKDELAALANVQVLHFDDLTKLLSFEDYEASCERLSSLLDRHSIRVDCTFERKVPSSISRSRSRTLVAHYRWEVQRIPFMDRQQEQKFCMGFDFLWRRLMSAREAAGFAPEDVDKQPGLYENPCAQCGPGRLRICFGCAPANLGDDNRERLRLRTKEFIQVRNELIERNLYIVFRLLERYRGVGIPEEDLIQEANASLFKAVEGFDFTRGVRFKTYGSYWVNQAFLNAIYNQSRTVRVPAYIQKAMKKINDAASTVGSSTYDRDALAQVSGVPVELVASALTGNRFTLSLDKSLDDDQGTRMVDLVEDADAGVDLESIEDSHLSTHLQEAMELLGPREQLILRMRYGMDGEEVKTLAEVGSELKISLERVRQIQKAALAKIRTGAKRRMLEQYA